MSHSVIYRAKVYRLNPTPSQEDTLGRWVGAVRFLYNLALEQRRDWWRAGRRFNYITQSRELTLLRQEVDWLADAPRQSLCQALRDLDSAFVNWWAGRAAYPTMRKLGQNDTMRFTEKLQKLSTKIAKNHSVVVLEDLNIAKMTRAAHGSGVRQKAGLNRSILDQSWGRFGEMLTYKLEASGGQVVKVNPAYTSQTCSACGVIDADSRRVKRFTCRACGHDADADHNASLNILAAGLAVTACGGSRWRPGEAGTTEDGIAANPKRSFGAGSQEEVMSSADDLRYLIERVRGGGR